MAAYVGERPAAWVDDVIPKEALSWAAARSVATLLVEVDPECGLERVHVERLLEWARTKRR